MYADLSQKDRMYHKKRHKECECIPKASCWRRRAARVRVWLGEKIQNELVAKRELDP